MNRRNLLTSAHAAGIVSVFIIAIARAGDALVFRPLDGGDSDDSGSNGKRKSKRKRRKQRRVMG